MFPIIDIAGAPRERGRQYGFAARGRILHSIATYARLFAYCGLTWGEAEVRALRYREPIAAAAPALLEEMAGTAEGAGVAESEILALNTRTEILPPTYPSDPAPDWSRLLESNRAAGVGDRVDVRAAAARGVGRGDFEFVIVGKALHGRPY